MAGVTETIIVMLPLEYLCLSHATFDPSSGCRTLSANQRPEECVIDQSEAGADDVMTESEGG